MTVEHYYPFRRIITTKPTELSGEVHENASNRKQAMPTMRGNRWRIDFEGSEDAVPKSETNYPGSSSARSLALHSELR
jgi:hypothetical protein